MFQICTSLRGMVFDSLTLQFLFPIPTGYECVPRVALAGAHQGIKI